MTIDWNNIKREIRMLVFAKLIKLAIKFLPKEAKTTWKWISEMPFDNFN